MPENIDIKTFQEAIVQGQLKITKGLESVDEKCFIKDEWEKPQGQALTGHGCTMVLKNGSVFEQAGVNVSVVSGQSMPASATAKRPEFSGCSFDALGISLVIHPRNPYIPTSHANVRLFMVKKDNQTIDWWFGGGFDLTPYYVFEEDAQYWHQQAQQACQPFGENLYPRFKKTCDEYFYLPHRQETRGIGGIFFDDFNELPFVESQDFTINVLNYYLEAYLPIVKLRKDTPYGQRERQFQKYRRGRYVEFNLLYDRGTHFGIQSGGRTESILMSLPPKVHFEYNYAIEAGSAESELSNYLVARDWI